MACVLSHVSVLKILLANANALISVTMSLWVIFQVYMGKNGNKNDASAHIHVKCSNANVVSMTC